MKMSRHSRLNLRIQHIVFIILIIACSGVAGWLSQTYNIRSDWTAGQRHSLGQQTVELLKQLNGPVNIRYYQTDDPTLNQAVKEILSRYQEQHPGIQFELLNPDIFIEQAKQDGIQRYGQSIVEYQGKQEHVDSLTEQNLSNALLRLQRAQQLQLLFINNHGERQTDDASAQGYSLLATQLEQQGFVIQKINLLQDTLSKQSTGANKVLVLGSIHSPLLPTEQEKLLSFINTGGNLLWLQDPAMDASQQSLSDALNLQFLPGVVVDNNQEIHRMLQLAHPAIIPILEYRVHPITQKMQYYTQFTTASAIRSKTEQTTAPHPWLLSDLLITSDKSWVEQNDYTQNIKYDSATETHGPLSIGIAQQRQLQVNDLYIAQRAVVIGDSDFISNKHLGEGANLEFILKTLNWLAEDEQAINIAPKNAPDLNLQLSATSASIIGIFFLVGLPFILLASGFTIWFKRRKR